MRYRTQVVNLAQQCLWEPVVLVELFSLLAYCVGGYNLKRILFTVLFVTNESYFVGCAVRYIVTKHVGLRNNSEI